MFRRTNALTPFSQNRLTCVQRFVRRFIVRTQLTIVPPARKAWIRWYRECELRGFEMRGTSGCNFVAARGSHFRSCGNSRIASATGRGGPPVLTSIRGTLTGLFHFLATGALVVPRSEQRKCRGANKPAAPRSICSAASSQAGCVDSGLNAART